VVSYARRNAVATDDEAGWIFRREKF